MIAPMRYENRTMRRLNPASLWRPRMVALYSVLALAACTGAAQDVAGTPGLVDTQAVAPAADENTVSIVRPLRIVEMKRPFVVVFDLPAPGPNATDTLFLGIRVNTEDSQQSAMVSDRVIAAGLDAEVNLTRIDSRTTQAIPLVRVDTSGQAPAVLVPVGPDGRVFGVRRDDVDDTSINQAGRASTAGYSRYLSFALAQNLAPGRYRLSVRIAKASAELSGLNSELLVAYRHKSK